jgi:hypothetical protein
MELRHQPGELSLDLGKLLLAALLCGRGLLTILSFRSPFPPP